MLERLDYPSQASTRPDKNAKILWPWFYTMAFEAGIERDPDYEGPAYQEPITVLYAGPKDICI
jgi:hypothetical protein